MTCEINFDGLVGPTHNYGGLSYGNIASLKNKLAVSAPRKAALQGLEKMKYLMDRGFVQGVLPPHARPSLELFRNLGFSGTDKSILKKVYAKDPTLFLQCSSASAMWVANAANVSPSIDTNDKKVHFTPANLISNFHRSLESNFSTKILRTIFSNQKYFTVHNPLPNTNQFSDEGAANFCRVTSEHGKKGFEIFVNGKNSRKEDKMKFPARQTAEANDAISRNHGLNEKYYFNLKQNPKVIDEGVFHNDVISVANENVFLYHENAFDSKIEFNFMQSKIDKTIKAKIYYIKVGKSELSVKEAVQTYLFNSQLLTYSKGKMLLLAPEECKKSKKVQAVIQKILNADNPINEVKYFDLRESMRNGGGPACLRLRVVLTENELAALSGRVILTDRLYIELVNWVNTFYREKLSPKDLADYNLFKTNQTALTELSKILDLGSICESN